MNRIHNTLPDNKVTNLQLFILDPLSVIIKLAILGNKIVGTKICIDNNIIYLQEPGPFQAICRYFYNSNKTDMQYLYNPIELACQNYLTKTVIQQNPKMKELFKCAQNGILKLIETYKNVSIMRLCLNYYYTIISNHIEDKFNDTLFRQDNMTPFYTKELTDKCNKIWSQEKIKIILNLTTYLSTNENAETDVKSLETIMNGIDKQVQTILS